MATPLFNLRVICLCCESPFIKNKHWCPIGLCTEYDHYDFCGVCIKLIVQSFRNQVPTKWVPKADKNKKG